MKHLKFSTKGFTLVEMLIVIGILAVLVAVVVSILNPAEFFKQTRDSRRLSDLNQLDQALNLATLDNVFMGTANVVYVSIPVDGDPDCSSLGLPAIPGWTYQCSTSANYRKVNGLGWIPIDFTALVTVPSALTLLPVDPTNSTSTNLFYTYVSGSWELTSLFESTKYTNQYHGFGTSTVYTSGNHQGISPNGIAMRAGSSGSGGSSATAPTAPQSLTPTAGNTQIVLNWSAPSSNGGAFITSYKVYRGTTSNGETVLSSGGCSGLGNVLTCTDTGLTNGTPYYYKVSAVNSVGEGTKSSEVSATPAAAPTVVTYATAGTFTWIAPVGVTSIKVETWGAGGGTPGNGVWGHGGGGGGGYNISATYSVAPGNGYTVVVGTGGAASFAPTDGNPGTASTFNGTVTAGGGGGGIAGGTTGFGGAGGTGLYTGGAGGNGVAASGGNGGGGGSSGGNASNGNTGSGCTAGSAVSGGGAGGNGYGCTGGPVPGYIPGGGGGGGSAVAGINGAGGQVKITY